MKKILSFVILSFALLTLFTACKKQDTKQQMISNVEHLKYDTIVAKPVDVASMNRADSCRYRADNVLRRYPEMYYATDHLTEAYKTWEAQERDFVEKVFVGKGRKNKSILAKNAQKLSNRMEQLNFIEALTAIVIDGADAEAFKNTNLSNVSDEKLMTECYRKIFFSIHDGIKSSNDDYSSDEMRTACEQARRSWLNYIKATDELLGTMPADVRAPMQQAIHNIICLHAIDLRNCYVQYWHENIPGFVLNDNCEEEQFEAADYTALKMRPWLNTK